jgi:hypothetical protein
LVTYGEALEGKELERAGEMALERREKRGPVENSGRIYPRFQSGATA